MLMGGNWSVQAFGILYADLCLDGFERRVFAASVVIATPAGGSRKPVSEETLAETLLVCAFPRRGLVEYCLLITSTTIVTQLIFSKHRPELDVFLPARNLSQRKKEIALVFCL